MTMLTRGWMKLGIHGYNGVQWLNASASRPFPLFKARRFANSFVSGRRPHNI
jgi:hypothetical protein